MKINKTIFTQREQAKPPKGDFVIVARGFIRRARQAGQAEQAGPAPSEPLPGAFDEGLVVRALTMVRGALKVLAPG